IIALILSVIAINPNPFAKGVEISFVQEGSPVALAGIKTSEQVLAVNRQPIETLSDYNEQMRQLSFPPVDLTLQTDKNTYRYASVGTPGLVLENLTVQKVDNQNLTAQGMKRGEKVISLNNNLLASDEDLVNLTAQLFPATKFVLTTDKQEYVDLIREPPEIR
ncbi:MAG: PDZ domain-containing protein, partial [Patescibacteria group bacterium]